MSDKQEEQNTSEEQKNSQEEAQTEETQNQKEEENTSAEEKESEAAEKSKETTENTEENTQDSGEVEVGESDSEKKEIPEPSELKPGMTVRVYQKIKELNMKKEEKERIQYFEGIIIAKKHNTEAGGTITVRRVVNGIGVEKIFPLNLPTITKIEIKKQAKVRRSKLYFLKKGYKKKLKEKKVN